MFHFFGYGLPLFCPESALAQVFRNIAIRSKLKFAWGQTQGWNLTAPVWVRWLTGYSEGGLAFHFFFFLKKRCLYGTWNLRHVAQSKSINQDLFRSVFCFGFDLRAASLCNALLGLLLLAGYLYAVQTRAGDNVDGA